MAQGQIGADNALNTNLIDYNSHFPALVSIYMKGKTTSCLKHNFIQKGQQILPLIFQMHAH